MRTRVMLTGLVAVGLGLVGSERHQTPNEPAADFVLKDLAGETVSLEELKGRPVLLNFWAVDCPGCRVEAPHLSAMRKKYADRGLVVLAVNAWNEPREAVARYVRDNALTQRILLNGAGVAKDGYGVLGLPASFWINKEGVVVHQLAGFSEHDVKRMEQWTEEIL